MGYGPGGHLDCFGHTVTCQRCQVNMQSEQAVPGNLVDKNSETRNSHLAAIKFQYVHCPRHTHPYLPFFFCMLQSTNIVLSLVQKILEISEK